MQFKLLKCILQQRCQIHSIKFKKKKTPQGEKLLDRTFLRRPNETNARQTWKWLRVICEEIFIVWPPKPSWNLHSQLALRVGIWRLKKKIYYSFQIKYSISILESCECSNFFKCIWCIYQCDLKRQFDLKSKDHHFSYRATYPAKIFCCELQGSGEIKYKET